MLRGAVSIAGAAMLAPLFSRFKKWLNEGYDKEESRFRTFVMFVSAIISVLLAPCLIFLAGMEFPNLPDALQIPVICLIIGVSIFLGIEFFKLATRSERKPTEPPPS